MLRVKSTMVLVVFFCMAVVFTNTAGAQPSKPIELSFAYALPPLHIAVKKVLEPWAKELEEKCGGRIKITHYPAESLVKGRDAYEGAVRGFADIVWGMQHIMPGRFPLTEVFHLPFLAPSAEAMVLAPYQPIYEKYLKREYKDVKVLYLSVEPPSQLLTKKPVRTLEDIKGIKINATGRVAPAVKEMGASPAEIPPPELYTSLQLGVIGGTISPLAGILGFRLYEVAKHATLAHVFSITTFLVMNLDKWNSLPPDIQKIIDEYIGIGAFDRRIPRTGLEMAKEAMEVMKKAGVEFIPLSPTEHQRWKKFAQVSNDKWLESIAAKGLPGKELLNDISEILEKFGK